MRPWGLLRLLGRFGLRHQQARHRRAADDVLLDDLVHVGFGHPAVPYGLGIDDDGRALLTLVEAPGLVGTDAAVQAALGQRLLERLLQRFATRRVTAPTDVPRLAPVAADEDVLVERGHDV